MRPRWIADVEVRAAGELVARLRVVVALQSVDEDRQEDEENECFGHGRNFALADFPPTVAAVTLSVKILPPIMGPC